MSVRLRVVSFFAGLALINWGAWRILHSDAATQESSAKPVGFSSRELIDTDGSRHKFIVFVPYQLAPDERPPMILYLNGFGENGDDGLMQIFENFGQPLWEMKRRFPFVVVAPQCPQGENWRHDGEPFQNALQMLDMLRKETNGDADRVILAGVSSAGGAIWNIARAYPDRFAAIVPVAAAGPAASVEIAAESLVQSGIPIWSSYNRFDKEKFVVSNRAMKSALLAAGGSPLYFENDAERHDSWNRTFRSPALYQWMWNQRVSSRPRQRFALLEPDELLATFHATGDSQWTADQAAIVAPGSMDDAAALVSAAVYDGFELHAEFRSDLMAPCGIVIRPELPSRDAAGEFRLHLVAPQRGSADLIADGAYLAAVDPLAQRSLLPNDWNDVRIRVSNGACIIHLNGWQALKIDDERLRRPVHVGFFQGPNATRPAKWRWVRIRSNPLPATASAEDDR